YLHSRDDPIKGANCWADGVVQRAKEQQDTDTGRIPICYMVDGFGLGYNIEALFSRLTGDAFIVVSEPNLAVLKTAFILRDYSKMLDKGQILFITRTDRQEIFNKLQQHSVIMMLGIVFTHPLQKIETAFHAEVHQRISEYASFMRSHMISLLANSVLTCRNILNNLPTYVATSSVEILKNRFKGYPAVIVSAGPSLQRNIDTLKAIRDNVVVIAVQTTLKPLLKKGIVPDFVTSLDYHEISKRFFDDLDEYDLSNVHLVAEPKATWHVIDAYQGRGPISLLGSDIAKLALGDLKDHHDHITAGATVAHLAFYLAEYIGAEPAIFIGQDLGYTNNVYYSPGNALHDVWKPELNRFNAIEMKEWERIIRSRDILRRTEDIHGNPIYTDEQMFTYLQQFEKDFAKSSTTIIDATEGGVRKQFSQTMTLKEVGEKYCTKAIDPKIFEYRKEIMDRDESKCHEAREQLLKRIEEVEELKDISVRTVAMVKEMLELLDDQPALNKKMIELDELRAMVRHREDIYQLIKYTSQNAEMFRFRQDRALDIDDVQGKERQRRQLMRDIGYVSELIKGAERMLELLKESDKRFDA
ncbi:MAG: DUF115 domain-containing protein, partial [Phycisphaerae bacterium]|nr:DUF115 domain-containing protein [Phycisphaerae bacterium]